MYFSDWNLCFFLQLAIKPFSFYLGVSLQMGGLLEDAYFFQLVIKKPMLNESKPKHFAALCVDRLTT